MSTLGLPPSMPIAATIDLQGRLPPPQQILLNPTIMVTIALLVTGLIIVMLLSRRAKEKAKRKVRRDALKMMERIVIKRGGSPDDVDKILVAFAAHPELNPTSIFMTRERFDEDLGPILEKIYDHQFRKQMFAIFFPPNKETRKALSKQSTKLNALVDEQKSLASAQASAAIQDLMDLTLKPGTVTRLAFEGIEGGCECLVMGLDGQGISITLPANNDQLIASLRPGMRIEGTLEHGPSLLAFTSSVIQAVAGSMPYCRIELWRSVWEVRKREAVRLSATLEIDFQHISTSRTDAIRISNLEKEPGAIRPGHLVDISLGGCCIETPSMVQFNTSDMVRFSVSLIDGSPPATLLGAIVNTVAIDPNLNNGSTQRLNIQFLIIDDVSQRLLVRALRRLQEAMEQDEWIQAQQLMQRMRRHNIPTIGSPAPSGYRSNASSQNRTHRDSQNGSHK